MTDLLERLRAGITTASADETQSVAAALAPLLPAEATLALHGNRGGGKTTFVQGLARGFGIGESVTSPTFNIYTLHRGPEHTLVHLDAYRLERSSDFDSLLLEEFLRPPWCLAIEWPEKIADALPSDAWHVDLGILPDQRHTVRLR